MIYAADGAWITTRVATLVRCSVCGPIGEAINHQEAVGVIRTHVGQKHGGFAPRGAQA